MKPFNFFFIAFLLVSLSGLNSFAGRPPRVMGPVHEGKVIVNSPTKNCTGGYAFGYASPQGRILITPRYCKAYPFREGVAFVFDGSRWGYIDPKGGWVRTVELIRVDSPNLHATADWILHGVRRVGERLPGDIPPWLPESHWKPGEFLRHLKAAPRVLVEVENDLPWGRLSPIQQEKDMYGPFSPKKFKRYLCEGCPQAAALDQKGNLIVGISHSMAETIREDRAWVYPYFGREPFGFYAVRPIANSEPDSDKISYEFVGSADFRGVTAFRGGFAAVKVKNLWGVIDRQTRFVVEPKYLEARAPGTNSLLAVKDPLSKKWGFIDVAGNIVVPFLYDSVESDFSEGYALVKIKDEILIIDDQGRQQILTK